MNHALAYEGQPLGVTTEQPNVKEVSKLDVAKEFVSGFNLSQCHELTKALADQVAKITGAAGKLDDAAEEIAEKIGDECGCGECEDCLRADVLRAYSARYRIG